MSPAIKAKRRRSRRVVLSIPKPQGVLQPRVQRVGPEHFGIVAIERTGRYYRPVERVAASGLQIVGNGVAANT